MSNFISIAIMFFMSASHAKYIVFLMLTGTCLFLSWSVASGQSEMSAEELFDLYVEQIGDVSSISFVSSFTDYIEPDDSKTNTLSMAWTIDFVGKRYRKQKVNDEETKGSSEIVLNGNTAISVSTFSSDIDTGNLPIGVTSYTAIPQGYWNKSIRLLYLSLPFGYFENGQECNSIVDTMRSEQKSMFREGRDVGLQCQTEEFDIKIWFDIDKNFAAKRIHIIRQNTQQQSPEYFTIIEYEVRDFQKIGERWFPSAYTVRKSFPGGTIQRDLPDLPPGVVLHRNQTEQKPRTLAAEVSLTNVRFPLRLADADFQIKSTVPNGTSVFMQDAPQIEHIWLDGKIVPKTNEAMLAIARGGHKFMPGPESPRFWFMAIGIILILIGGGRLAYKYIRGEATL